MFQGFSRFLKEKHPCFLDPEQSLALCDCDCVDHQGQAFLVPASKLLLCRVTTKSSTQLIMQLAIMLRIGIVFTPALPLATLLLFIAATSSCMLAVLPLCKSFQVKDDTGIARAGIRLAVLWSMVVNAFFFLE